jgi:hypothetical protein
MAMDFHLEFQFLWVREVKKDEVLEVSLVDWDAWLSRGYRQVVKHYYGRV